jgi:hypothetical protein
MLQTSPIIMTSLKLKDVMNYKQEPTAHAINIEVRKNEDGDFKMVFGYPSQLHWAYVGTHEGLIGAVEQARLTYCHKNRINTEIEKGEIERIKKLLI